MTETTHGKDSGLNIPETPTARVMVVEDSQEFQVVFLLTLSCEPYLKLTHMTDSGEEAIQAIERVSPDLVLLDYQLPGIDALRTARLIKKQCKGVKAALITDSLDDVAEPAVEGAEVDEVIPRINFSLARVRQLLARNS